MLVQHMFSNSNFLSPSFLSLFLLFSRDATSHPRSHKTVHPAPFSFARGNGGRGGVPPSAVGARNALGADDWQGMFKSAAPCFFSVVSLRSVSFLSPAFPLHIDARLWKRRARHRLHCDLQIKEGEGYRAKVSFSLLHQSGAPDQERRPSQQAAHAGLCRHRRLGCDRLIRFLLLESFWCCC